MTKKQIIILLVLIAILVAGIFVFKSQFGLWPWQAQERQQLPSAVPGNEDNQVQPQEEEARQMIMKDAAATINEISQVEPVLGGKWNALRFWFVNDSDKDFYVEYEDGHIMGRMLLEVEIKDEDVFYKIVGYFEPGDADWVLKSGQDTQFGKPLDLYEYDEVDKNWVKKN